MTTANLTDIQKQACDLWLSKLLSELNLNLHAEEFYDKFGHLTDKPIEIAKGLKKAVGININDEFITNVIYH